MALDVAENGDRETADDRRATPYRMVMADHVCPYGLKSKDLLERKGYRVDDAAGLHRRRAAGPEQAAAASPFQPAPGLLGILALVVTGDRAVGTLRPRATSATGPALTAVADHEGLRRRARWRCGS
jgi:hypothetical protein